jgi:hypothetical protein
MFLLATLPLLAHADISINAHIDNPSPWVREEVLLTVEVVDDRAIIEQKTAPWTPPGVSLRLLNPSEERIQTPEGVRILRRQYWAVMPLYAGELSLQPPTVEARLSGQGRVSLTPAALHFNVRPLNPLLPADVPVSALHIKLTRLPEAVPRGRPFNVDLNIQGSGLSTRGIRHWLDESLRSSAKLRIYPPEIALHNNIDPAQPLQQQADVRLTFETTASGRVQLSAIILPYVDPADGAIQHAVLPVVEIRSEHPLWLAMRPWLPWTAGLVLLILIFIGVWRLAQPCWQAAQKRHAGLVALSAAESPKALRSVWHSLQLPQNKPKSEALATRLDAACYGPKPLNQAAFDTLKNELIEQFKRSA